LVKTIHGMSLQWAFNYAEQRGAQRIRLRSADCEFQNGNFAH
jgi:hypothetical protein